MDEKQISELLECSVCFEQLDQSCKVLPCQHTFCRRCLDEILWRKHELRCPECRTLVKIPVSDLPTNILVVRILEGLKTQGHKSGSRRESGKAQCGVSSTPSGSLGLSPHRYPRDGHGATAGYIRHNQPCVKALYSYESSEKEDLPFKKGDLIILRRQIDENWYLGELGGKSGFFPANFVQVINALPQVPQSKALYDFDLKDENEKDCLSFKKEEVITVIRRVDDNWLEGRQGEKIGIFPISFVELNDAARILVNSKNNNSSSTISGISSSSSPSTLPPTTAVDSSTSPTPGAISTNGSTAQPGQVSLTPPLPSSPSSSSMLLSTPASSDTRLSSMPAPSVHSISPQNKRHSFTSSSTCSSPLPLDSSQQRHSMELILSSESTPVSTTQSVVSSVCTTMTTSVSTAMSAQSWDSESASHPSSADSPSISPTPVHDVQASSNADTTGGGHSGSQNIPIYIALYNYYPQKDDELELHKGDHYSVVEKCQDGWFKGSCMKTGQHGVFPGNYVTLLRHSSAFKPMNPNVLNIRAKVPNSPLSQSSSVTPHQSSTSPAVPHQRPSPSMGGINQNSDFSLDSSITSGPPPLMPRVAKMTPGTKSRQTSSSHLMAIPLRSLSSPGTSSSPPPPPSSLVSASSLSLMPHSSKGKPATPHVPAVFTSPHRHKTWTSAHHNTHPSLVQQSMSVTTITPPNVVMASSHDGGVSSLFQALSKDKDKKKKKEEKKRGGFLNLLKDKKSKLTSSSSEPETQTLPVTSLDAISHTRSGSFPGDGSPSSGCSYRGGGDGGLGLTIEHRKTVSLDATATLVQPGIPDKPRMMRTPRNKYCCVVPYPPQMTYELDLEVGDIVHVLRKREDGWYKGFHERTGRTGMFPASFVEKSD